MDLEGTCCVGVNWIRMIYGTFDWRTVVDGHGFESHQGQAIYFFFVAFRPALGLRGSLPRLSGRVVKLISYLNLASMVRISGALPVLPLCTFAT
jgi:hypothetical protein